MKTNLAQIVLQDIEFFSLASDSDIHPDIAVRQLEIIADLLKQLSAEELNYFLEQAKKRMSDLQSEGASQEQINILKNISQNLGV